ncbi:MAG: AAA family ATPase [Deltaproteobacteria bacterium]|nr:AAA family ATPase [Deltaproteobacteria bacterium]
MSANNPAQIDYELSLADTYQRSLLKLSAPHQAEANKTIMKLTKGFGSTHLHGLNPMPWHSFCCNKDALRVICHREGNQLILVHINTHQEAYDWARNHAPRQLGRALRIVNVEEGDESSSATIQQSSNHSAAQQAEQPPGPLATFRDKDFRHFEVGPKTATLLRGVPDEDALIDLLAHFKAQLAEALISLATDSDLIADILNIFQEATKSAEVYEPKIDIHANINAASIWVPPAGSAALKEALSGALDSWKIFLHPSQCRIVRLDASGAVKVTGGPGTGKSVVALHRARYLVEHVFSEEGVSQTGPSKDVRPILLCTFSRALAEQLEIDLQSLCVDVPEVLERIKVKTLHQVAQETLANAGKVLSEADDDAQEHAWQEALEEDKLDFDRAFYEAERELVVLASGCETEKDYLKAKRRGRPKKLNAASKQQVWKVIKKYDATLAANKTTDALGLSAKAAWALVSGVASSPYAAVICDEVQDTSATELRLLAALSAGDEGKTRRNALFLVGDGHQRLYRRPVSLLACGVDIRGRAFKLKLNYRTTQGICSAALKHLEGVPLDEIDADDDVKTSKDALRGYRSVRSGPSPKMHTFSTASEEADWIVSLCDDEEPLLVLVRKNKYLEELAQLLQARGASPVVLGSFGRPPKGAPLVLSSLHRSKGLESPRVVVAGMQETPARWPGSSAGEKELWRRKENSLLYVGLTRARDWCGLSKVTFGETMEAKDV